MDWKNVYAAPVLILTLMVGAMGYSAYAGFDDGVYTSQEVPVDQLPSQVREEPLDYVDRVTVYKNGEPLFQVHNALMEGEAIVRNQSTSASNNVNWKWDTISLGNGDAPSDTSKVLDSEFAGSGLAPAAATLEKIDSNGGDNSDGIEWNYTHTFTASATETVNTTAIKSQNAPADLDYYAGATFASDVNLQSGDDLTVEWNFDVD